MKQLGAGLELAHCDATQTLEAFMTSTVTLVGVGGAGGVTNYSELYEGVNNMTLYIPLAGRETILGVLVVLI